MIKSISNTLKFRKMLGSVVLTSMVSLPAIANNVTFTEIPVPNWGGSSTVSENGVVAFTDDTRLMKWTPETGVVVLGETPWARVFDVQISTDGNVVAYIDPNTGDAYVYTGSTERYIDRAVINVHTLSPDGLTLGGRQMNSSTGLAATLNLADDSITTYSHPEANFRVVDDISSNGTLLISTPGYYSPGPSYTLTKEGESQLVSGIQFIQGFSEDGQSVLGEKYNCDNQAPNTLCAATFNVNTGVISELGYFRPTAINVDGSLVVGNGWSDVPGAKVWDAFNGSRNISDVLISKGIDVSDWDFTGTVALNVSDNGNKIVGHAINPDGDTVPFIINVIPQCNGF